MILKLDIHTCEKFIEQWITDVNVDIFQSGCAGSKISVSSRLVSDHKISTEKFRWITCWIEPDLAEKFDGAQIAQSQWRYFLVSKNIQTRCGCGTSFSFEKKSVSQDLAKIHRLKNMLQSSPQIQIIQEIIQVYRKK